MPVRPPAAATRILAALAVWLVAYEADVLFGFTGGTGVVFGKPAHLLISFAAAALCFAGALRRRGTERVAFGVIALGIAAWNVGDTYWTTVLIEQESIPVPSLADAGYLAFPVLVFAAIALLMRPVMNVTSRLLLVDGLAAGLAVGAVVASAIFGAVIDRDSDSLAVNLAYTLSDLVLLGLVVGAVAVRGWRIDRMWGLIGAAIVAFWVADTAYFVAIARDTYAFPAATDAGWTACFLALAAASWQPAAAVAPTARLGRRVTLMPLGFAALALCVLAVAGLHGGSHTAVALAVGSLVAVGARMLVTFSAHVTMLDASRHEALSDPLTGLGNRRRLIVDLDRAVAHATLGTPQLLVLFDLDGFKHYNDSFGHPAGDALLARLGGRLRLAVGPAGTAYRMGGDEFCVLAPLAGTPGSQLCERGASALREVGSGFAVGASFGSVVLPFDAEDAEQALRTADQRMYAHKDGGRSSAVRQISDVLVTALVERDGELGSHVRDVAVLAAGVAQALGLDERECGQVRQAAVLHDVGKVAIPDAILDKPGPLEDEEWTFMRRHTLVGERIISAAPALRGVAEIVRSSHERWDGTGYPDALAGEEIPLGARIIAVCDAYDAMCTARSYSPAVSPVDALRELRRCRGTQFDPLVVDAFCRQRVALPADPVAVG